MLLVDRSRAGAEMLSSRLFGLRSLGVPVVGAARWQVGEGSAQRRLPAAESCGGAGLASAAVGVSAAGRAEGPPSDIAVGVMGGGPLCPQGPRLSSASSSSIWLASSLRLQAERARANGGRGGQTEGRGRRREVRGIGPSVVRKRLVHESRACDGGHGAVQRESRVQSTAQATELRTHLTSTLVPG